MLTFVKKTTVQEYIRCYFLILFIIVGGANRGMAQLPDMQIDGVIGIGLPLDSTSIFIGHRNYSSKLIESLEAGGIDDSYGFNNTVIGYKSGDNLEDAWKSVIIGSSAAPITPICQSCVVIGNHSAEHTIEIVSSTLMGDNAGALSESHIANTFIGSSAGSSQGDQEYATSIGNGSLASSYGDYTSYIGYRAGISQNGDYNSGIGHRAGAGLIGARNTSLGTKAGENAIGQNSVYAGLSAGRNSVGSNNIYIGRSSGAGITGAENIILGEYTSLSSENLSDRLIIANTTGDAHIISDRKGDSTQFFTRLFKISPTIESSTDEYLQYTNSTLSNVTKDALKARHGLYEKTNDKLFGFEWEYNGETDKLHLRSKGFTDNEAIRMSWLKNGRVGIGTSNPQEKLHVAGNIYAAGTITQMSDINSKYDINKINAQDILQKISQLDISYWKYKGTNETHVGPMAQDFYAAFGLGGSDTTIATVDADGVALAAIKALAEKNIQLEKKNKQLEKTVRRHEVILEQLLKNKSTNK